MGAGKVLSLVSAPLSLLFPRRPSAAVLCLSSSAVSTHTRRRRFSAGPLRYLITVRTSNQTVSSEPSLASQCLSGAVTGPEPSVWVEWSQLVELLADKGYFDRAGSSVNELRENGDFSEEFVRTSEALILFAKENPELIRSLPKKDIAVLVENVSPHFFKNGEISTLRLKSFLNGIIDNGIQAELAETMDLIPYILSYACVKNNNNNNNNNEIIDESINNMLIQFVNLSKLNQRESPVQNISTKRGDWICIKCKLMNFARANKCFECSEPRPRRILTGEKWDCPQCDFFNHGRNISCLRCDYKKPAEITKKLSVVEDILNKATIMDNGSKPDKDPTINQTLDKIFGPSNSKETNNNELNNETNWESLATVKDPNPNPRQNNGSKPDKDPTINQTLDKISRPSNLQETNNNKLNNKINWESLATQRGEPGHVPFKPLPANKFSKNNKLKSTDRDARSGPLYHEEFPEVMPGRKGENRFVISKRKDRSLTSPQYKRRIAFEQANNDDNNAGNNSHFVPFVPLPPDYFAKKRENKTASVGPLTEKIDETGIKRVGVISSQENSYSNKSVEGSYSENSYSNKSVEGLGIAESEPLDMSEDAKAERWFRRAAQIKDISELANIPDEDFPEIMPMRKGVNRFVVSKRKTPLERRLANNSLYRRNDLPRFGGGNDESNLSES